MRRLILGLVVPWVLLAIAVVIPSSIVFDGAYERWWEYKNRPGERHDVDTVWRGYRPLGSADEFGSLHHPRSLVPNKIYHTVYIRTDLRLTTPRPDGEVVVLLVSVALSVLLSVLMACLMVRIAVALARWRGRLQFDSGVAATAATWFAPGNVFVVLCMAVLLVSMLLDASVVGETERILVLAAAVCPYLAWGVNVMARLGEGLQVRWSGSAVFTALLLAAGWSLSTGIIVLLFVAPLLVRARH